MCKKSTGELQMKKKERKNSNMKQLQAECKKRNIGFMTSWTKIALIKRLEDEDKRDNEISILKGKIKSEQIKSKKNKALVVSTEKMHSGRRRPVRALFPPPPFWAGGSGAGGDVPRRGKDSDAARRTASGDARRGRESR